MTITINNAGTPGFGLNWFEVGDAIGVAMQSNAGYYQSVGTVPYTLPFTALQNDAFMILGCPPSTGFSIAVTPGYSQSIQYNGVGHETLTTASSGGTIMLICSSNPSGPGSQKFIVINTLGVFS